MFGLTHFESKKHSFIYVHCQQVLVIDNFKRASFQAHVSQNLKLVIFRWGILLFMSLFPSFRHAPCLGTVHHLIIIFGTFVLNDDISRCFFSFLQNFYFLDKRTKNGPKWQKILSVLLHNSGNIHHMIVIYGAHV